MRVLLAEDDPLLGQNDMAREDLAQKLAWHNLLPFVLGKHVLVIAAALFIGFGWRPLNDLTRNLLGRARSSLDDIEMRKPPVEVAQVGEAVNTLFGRLRRAFANERRFVADAAHELRTPLSGMKVQIQSSLMDQDERRREEGFLKALKGVERMQHLISQLLFLSRLDMEMGQGHRPEPVTEADLVATARQACVDLGPEASRKGIDLALEVDSGFGDAAAHYEILHLLVRNLVDNAIRYTPKGGWVTVTVAPGERGLMFKTTDSGPGVPADKLAQLGQRFFRCETAGAEGAGLGLSIVARIAEYYDAAIGFANSESGGFEATVEFPRVA